MREKGETLSLLKVENQSEEIGTERDEKECEKDSVRCSVVLFHSQFLMIEVGSLPTQCHVKAIRLRHL